MSAGSTPRTSQRQRQRSQPFVSAEGGGAALPFSGVSGSEAEVPIRHLQRRSSPPPRLDPAVSTAHSSSSADERRGQLPQVQLRRASKLLLGIPCLLLSWRCSRPLRSPRQIADDASFALAPGPSDPSRLSADLFDDLTVLLASRLESRLYWALVSTRGAVSLYVQLLHCAYAVPAPVDRAAFNFIAQLGRGG